MRPAVAAFAKAMEEKLQAYDDKRGERGWERETVSWLLDRVAEEVDEAKDALKECDPHKLKHEVVDVSNFCMMIHDLLTERQERERQLAAKLQEG